MEVGEERRQVGEGVWKWVAVAVDDWLVLEAVVRLAVEEVVSAEAGVSALVREVV